MRELLLGLLIALINMGADAADCRPDLASTTDMAALFAQAYSSPDLYRPAQCGRNVKKLLLEFNRKGADTSKAKVLVLLHELRSHGGGPILPGKLRPAANRSFDKAWDFHVVLEWDGKIFDLAGPSWPLPVRGYFARMFPGEDRWSRIALREVPAADYLRAFESYDQTRDMRRSFDENYVVGEFRSLLLPGYPVRRLSDYLNEDFP